MRRILQLKKALRAALFVLLLNVVGMTKMYAYSFSAVCSTGQTLYYNIIDAENHYVELTYPGTNFNSGWYGFTKPTGDIILSNSVQYNGVTYTLTKIGNGAFYSCRGLTGELSIPNSVISIGNSAFSGCSGLTGNLTISCSVTTIGSAAFSGCSGFTGSLTIPNSVTTISNSAFRYCSGLTGDLTIPNSVTTIGNYAFEYCNGLTGNLTIPNSLTSIGEESLPLCFEQIIVSSGNTVFDSRSNCNAIIHSSTNQLILGCKNTVIPNSVTSIGDCAFYGCSGLVSIEIPNSVTSIGSYAFQLCSGLTGDLTIPNSVTTIGSSAFFGCSDLTGDLTIPNSVTSIGSYAFLNCRGFSGNLIIGNSVTTIGEYAFSGCSGFSGNLIIGNSVITIGNSAFSGCSDLTGGLTIPNSVTTIGSAAFSSCSGFTGSLTIPNSVTTIGSAAFWNCSNFSGDLIIGNSVTTIGEYAFNYCSNLISVIALSETPPALGSDVFFNPSLNSIPVYVPCGCVEAYQSAAYWNQFTNIQELCTQSQTITLSQGWNWISTYIDMENNDGLSQLTDCLGTNGLQIITTGGSLIYRGGSWIGSITSLSNTKAYKIKTNVPVTVTITGSQAADPANCEIQIMNGWNWIAYPLSESKTVAEALAGFEPSNGDNIKTQGGSAVYRNGNWLPNTFTFEPGKGYTYKSMATQPKTLIFQTGSKQ